MQNAKWMIEVLSDMRIFAVENKLEKTARMLTSVEQEAKKEIASVLNLKTPVEKISMTRSC